MTAASMSADVVVIGGGHAGTEAAAAAARRGAQVILVCLDRTSIGAMSCNPAIGGLGKGHIVREIDAFDGLMARAADTAAIHYRMLNRSKGAAVRGPRVQADRMRYAAAIQAMLAAQDGITIVEGEVSCLTIVDRSVAGVMLTDRRVISAPSVILATGTFLGGRMFRGAWQGSGGRVGERAATALGEQLRALRLPMGRMKTGTPPRLDGRTIDWASLERQPSDDEEWTMSALTTDKRLPQVHCGVTRTTVATHDVVRSALDRSPLFDGAIAGTGPRYCPSIEDKVVRFGDRDGHQVFLEPEGLDDPIVYPNGISTSLPDNAQAALIATIPGLEHASIVTAGYAVEYDHIDPRALGPTMELRAIAGLFCAGQINGTTGYEEAAGQGLVAGLNAAAHAGALSPIVLDRSISYIGVMVDDLVLQGVTEPYRMLTARAEYRLALRIDNADSRLSDDAERAGVLSADRRRFRARYRHALDAVNAALSVFVEAPALAARGAAVCPTLERRTGADWLRVAAVTLDHLPSLDRLRGSPAIDEAVENARYAPYIARQRSEQSQLQATRLPVPTGFDFAKVAGLSTEMVERLGAAMPCDTLSATRIRGVTPAALSALMLHLRAAT